MSLSPALATIRKKPVTPFERMGGREPVARLANRFYDLMESEPDLRELRAMHAPDLAPMRESLTDFLVAWMGGPRDWFDKNPGACIMSAHSGMRGMGAETARQWMAAMTRAAEDVIPDAELRNSMLASMASMGRTMARRAETGSLSEDYPAS